MSDNEQLDSELSSASSDIEAPDMEESNEEMDNTMSGSDSSAGLAAKERERQKIQADIEAFLASGGTIQSVDNNVVCDPPKKPESSYGSQPI